MAQRKYRALAALFLILLTTGWAETVLGAADPSKLIEMLSSPEVTERREAARKLGQIKDPAAIPPLIHALKDNEPMVRLEASGALMDIGQPVAEPLIEAVQKEKASTFLWNAIRILERLEDPRAIEPLKEIARENPDRNIEQAARYTIERLEKKKKPPQ